MSAPNESKTSIAGTVAVFVGLLAGVFLASHSSTSTTTTSSGGDDGKASAWVMAERFVADGLRCPSTASFGGVFSGDFQSYNDTVSSLGDGRYTVKAWVDSQNGFGAMVRSHFTCEVEKLSEGKWRCNRLEFSP